MPNPLIAPNTTAQAPGNQSPGDQAQPIVIEVRSSVSADHRVVGGRRAIALHDDVSGKFFHVGSEESVFFSLIDGVLTVDEIADQMRAVGIAWTDADVKAFMSLLVKSNIVSVVRVGEKAISDANTREAVAPKMAIHRVASSLGLVLSQRIPLGNADRLAAICLPWLRPLFIRQGFGVWLVGVIAASWIAWGLRTELVAQCRLMFSPSSWVGLFCLGIAIKAVHELGHAVMAKRLSVRVGSVGITFFLLAPLAYVDLTNAWKLSARMPRILIAMGGVYLESWLAIVATFLFAWLDDGIARHLAAQAMVIAGPATWLTNANPLLRLDGYYVLSDAAAIPNLRMHGRAVWASLLDHWLLKKPYRRSLLVGWRVWFAALHAAASIVFQCFWMIGIIVAVSSWTTVLGTIVAAAAVGAWVAMPMVLWWLKNWNAHADDAILARAMRRRMLSVAMTGFTLGSLFLSARNPVAHGVPVLVQHRNEQIGRASTDGFVTAVSVNRNDLVRRGDVLVEITDDGLVLQREQMSDDLRVSSAKYRQLQSSGQLAEADAANERCKQLRVSLAELDQSILAMRIVATRDGVVVSEQPRQWVGRYAKRGDVLVRVADPNDKELLVAISEDDFSAYDRSVRRQSLLASRLRGGERLSVEPMAAQPRFLETLNNPALASTSGGDVTMIPDASAEGGFKPATPVGTAIALISPTQSLIVRSGQRGTLYLDDDQTIYARLKQWMFGQ